MAKKNSPTPFLGKSTTTYLGFEARSIRDTGRCSRDRGGRKVPYAVAEFAFPGGSDVARLLLTVKCPVCGRSSPKYCSRKSLSRGANLKKTLNSSTAPPRLRVDLSGLLASSSGEPTPYSMQGATVIRVKPGKRRAEPIGSEQTDYDNSKSSSSSVESLRIAHSMGFAVSFGQEKATTTRGRASAALLDFASISGELEKNLRRHHAVEAKSTFTVERTSQIQVPPHTHVRVIISWKRIWQDGSVKLKTTSGDEISVPYSVTVDLSFDKKVVDVP